MVSKLLKVNRAIALALVLALVAPVGALADAKKQFKEGLKYEENKQWDKAAEKFALAVAEKPSNVEYQLHLQRALVMAGVMLVERGDQLAEQKDYNAAYHAYRQAYAFDPTNQLSLLKMRRMLEAQGLPTDSLPNGDDPAGPKGKPDRNNPNMKAGFTNGGGMPRVLPAVDLPGMNARRFPKTDIIARSDNLLSVIEQLAQDMKLNVVFDQQVSSTMRNNKLQVELRDVTKPKALEIILRTNNLMYAQVDSRTIVIALDNAQSRMKFEPLAVRTFYVKNADITDMRQAIQQTLQSKQIVPVKQLNALIVRDTPSNLELISSLIDSLDKAKAEVLIDVSIYEVSRNDLLSIGNQFNPTGDSAKGIPGFAFLGGIGRPDVQRNSERTLTGAFGLAIGLPTSAISLFQDRGKAKLLASTQVHVLDAEQHAIRIGQRVPIQTAVFQSPTISLNNNRNNNNQNNNNNPNNIDLGLGGFGFGNGAFPQIQYENVGLNIDMQPTVFEDEVQMKMKIESTSVDASTGTLTPSFNQRTMSSVARIKDGQTTLVAGVSQNVESKSVKGLPIIGLIPILGRFFATPETRNTQSDVVITVTPHILRRADIRDDDHLARNSGTQADPTTQLTIEQILYLAEQEDANQNQVASTGGGNGVAGGAARPASKTVLTVPSPTTPINQPVNQPVNQPGVVVTQPPTVSTTQTFKPTVERKPVAQPGLPPGEPDDDDEDDEDDEEATPQAQRNGPLTVSVKSAAAVATKGQDLYVAIIVNGNGEISGSNISLAYDPNIIEVKGVRDGGLLRAGGANPELQFSAEGGQLNVQLERPAGSGGVPARGQLLLLIFTVKGQGQTNLVLNEQTSFRSPTGEALTLKLQSTQIEAR